MSNIDCSDWKTPDKHPYVDDAISTTWGYTSDNVILVYFINGKQYVGTGFFSEDCGWMAFHSDSDQPKHVIPVSALFWTDIPRRKQYIIAGMAGVGKSMLAKKYPGMVADVESSGYKHDNTGLEHLSVEERKGLLRTPNPEWPDNYISAIRKAMKKYPIVCIQLHPDNYEVYKKANIPFIIVYPERDALDEYYERLIGRGNNREFADKIVNTFDDFVLGRCIHECDNERWILKKGETLEDRFKALGVLS